MKENESIRIGSWIKWHNPADNSTREYEILGWVLAGKITKFRLFDNASEIVSLVELNKDDVELVRY